MVATHRPPGVPRRAACLEATSRPGSGVRRLARLDPYEAAAYRRTVARLAPWIERSLARQVIANRARGRGANATTRLEPWRPARRAWDRTISHSLDTARPPVIVAADVAACYASISADVVDARLRQLAAPGDAVAEVLALIRTFNGDGVPGLPVGPSASALLANAVLAAVDEALTPIAPHRRWVDDLVVFAPDPVIAGRALDEIRRSLDGLGLEVNERKTAFLSDPQEARRRLLRSVGPSGASAVR